MTKASLFITQTVFFFIFACQFLAAEDAMLQPTVSPEGEQPSSGEGPPKASSLSQISQILASQPFKGQWSSAPNFKAAQLGFLTQSEGESHATFYVSRRQNKNAYQGHHTNEINSIELRLLDPKYEDRHVLTLDLNLTGSYDSTKNHWIGQTTLNYTGSYKFRQNFRSKYHQDCQVFYTIQLINAQTLHTTQIDFSIDSLDYQKCQINLNGQLKFAQNDYSLETIAYCFYVVCISIMQYICINHLIDHITKKPQDASRFSIITLGFICIYDSYFCLQNLFFALLNYLNFQYFITPAISYFILVTTAEMKFLWMIWKHRFVNHLQDEEEIKKRTTSFFLRFYSCLVSYFVIMYFLEVELWFWMGISLFITPQIYYNVLKGQKPKFMFSYALGFLATHIAHPVYKIIEQQIYFRGCPENFRKLEPSQMFCTLEIILYGAQILLLFIQFRFGARAFLPKCLFPKEFNYFVVVPENYGCDYVNSQNIRQNHDDCAICLSNILGSPILTAIDENHSKILMKKIMITPCKHKFHVSCLKQWMDVKLQCPTCRKSIPAIYE